MHQPNPQIYLILLYQYSFIKQHSYLFYNIHTHTHTHFSTTHSLTHTFFISLFSQIDLHFLFILLQYTLPLHYTATIYTTTYMSTASIPLPNLDSLLAPIHLFSSYNHFISTNNKFFKFYLFTLWFLLHFKHSINTHDFNLIIQSLVNSFHNQSHNAFDIISFKFYASHLFHGSSTEH